MSAVAGIDFGTLSVRVSLFDHERGRLGTATTEYPLLRDPRDTDHASQRHADHLNALESAMRASLREAGVRGEDVKALGVATTSSTIVPVDDHLRPLGDYYLWCDHRAHEEAAQITELAHSSNLPALAYCGGVYSSEMGWAKLLHWLRNNPNERPRLATALEHGDMMVSTLTGVANPAAVVRNACALGHKWMWNPDLGGLPPEEFLSKVDPLLGGVRESFTGRVGTAVETAGGLSAEWAARLGLTSGIPVCVAGVDAHWDAIGAGIAEGDVVNVIGTSTCVMAITRENRVIPGVCGIARSSIHPGFNGIEAGLSAAGEIFDSIARRAQSSVSELSGGLEAFRPGQTGLLRLVWDNGDRTVLTNPALGGVTLGWNLAHSARDELFAAIEGTAFHTRIIVERMSEHGVPVNRVIHAGGIPQKNPVLNQVYANVINKPILVPEAPITGLGSAIFAFIAAGTFPSVEEAQKALCPSYRVFVPQASANATYSELFAMYRNLYFAMGLPSSPPIKVGDVLPRLKRIRGN